MKFQTLVYLHEQGWSALGTWWIVLIFAVLAEIAILMQSKRLTKRGAVEMTLTTLVPFLLFFWGLRLLHKGGSNMTGVNVGLAIPTILGLGVGLLRGIGGAMLFPSGYVWAILASLPVPLFVYFTAWVTIK